jgi:hypothetical protein
VQPLAAHVSSSASRLSCCSLSSRLHLGGGAAARLQEADCGAAVIPATRRDEHSSRWRSFLHAQQHDTSLKHLQSLAVLAVAADVAQVGQEATRERAARNHAWHARRTDCRCVRREPVPIPRAHKLALGRTSRVGIAAGGYMWLIYPLSPRRHSHPPAPRRTPRRLGRREGGARACVPPLPPPRKRWRALLATLQQCDCASVTCAALSLVMH